MSRVIQALVIWVAIVFASLGITCLVVYTTASPTTVVCEQLILTYLLVFGCLAVVGCALWIPATIVLVCVSNVEKVLHNGWMCTYNAFMCIYTAMTLASGVTFSAIAVFSTCATVNSTLHPTVLAVLIAYAVTVGLVWTLACCKAFTRTLD